MVFTAPVASLIPGMMSLSVLGRSTQMIPKTYWDNGKKNSKKAKKIPIIKGFTEIMIGVPMISATAGMVSGL